MYRRLIAVSVVILVSLGGLVWLGLRTLELQQEALEGKRLKEFAAVAENVRSVVKRQLDAFIQNEQRRDYTEYQYAYVPEDAPLENEQVTVMRSPLSTGMEQGLAFGHFQIDSDEVISTPYYQPGRGMSRGGAMGGMGGSQGKGETSLNQRAKVYVDELRENLLPILSAGQAGKNKVVRDDMVALNLPEVKEKITNQYLLEKSEIKAPVPQPQSKQLVDQAEQQVALGVQKQQSYKIDIQQSQEPRVETRSRGNVAQNFDNRGQRTPAGRRFFSRSSGESNVRDTSDLIGGKAGVSSEGVDTDRSESRSSRRAAREAPSKSVSKNKDAKKTLTSQHGYSSSEREKPALMAEEAEVKAAAVPLGTAESDRVNIQIEPFKPLVVRNGVGTDSIFGGEVFLVRRVQIENDFLLQGFRLNEAALLELVREAAEANMGDRMSFDLGRQADEGAAYQAVLDFGFGSLTLNLHDLDPGWIVRQVKQAQYWYTATISIVFLVVGLGLMSLWRNVREQLRLAQQKDDFISAVSHELRTPLTSIRMYTEMLEKNWVKSDEQRNRYYGNMRQESERLSRLIENVLDFSRIQRGRKRYDFQEGDINQCVEKGIDTMRPFAEQSGFVIQKELAQLEPMIFDHDAAMQIVINLLDNAIKYGGDGEDNRVVVRTRQDGSFVLIEVEDHGSGVPLWHRQKVFEEFYRCQPEDRRETTGTGLGLALVKRFALAHDGFVEIFTAKPQGALFRVGLASGE
ncbi:MAG: HAMP domain-containing histidine kinase [Sedimentisphaerales bacterium]|nr:HAMP domain-containing histidine kinase [Sedimentisphaerales bacterium]